MTVWLARPFARPIARVLTGALDLVLPPRCLGCGALVEVQGALCPGCWSAVTFVADPLCHRCGLPFAFDSQELAGGAAAALECGACLAAR